MTPLLVWSWPETPIVLAVIVVLALVTRWLLIRAIDAAVQTSLDHARARTSAQGGRADRILATATGATHARHEARTRTIGSLLRSVVSVVVLVVAILTILQAVDAPLGPLLASAGIGGIAFGFGAQSLVKDYLSGIFMIFEDQYGVGDLIDTGDVRGTVEDIGLRITRVRDVTGQVWYLRNGEITRLGNQSQGWSTGIVDVPVAVDEDAARVVGVLNAVVDDLFADEAWESVLLERPDVVGVDRVEAGAMVVRILAKCAPNQHWALQRALLERAQTALRTAGVRSPAGPLAPGSAASVRQ